MAEALANGPVAPPQDLLVLPDQLHFRRQAFLVGNKTKHITGWRRRLPGGDFFPGSRVPACEGQKHDLEFNSSHDNGRCPDHRHYCLCDLALSTGRRQQTTICGPADPDDRTRHLVERSCFGRWADPVGWIADLGRELVLSYLAPLSRGAAVVSKCAQDGRHGDCAQTCQAVWPSGLRRKPRQLRQLAA